jgi:hypothetical protein
MAEVIRMQNERHHGRRGGQLERLSGEQESGFRVIFSPKSNHSATMDMESYEEGTILYIGVEKAKPFPMLPSWRLLAKSEDFSH